MVWSPICTYPPKVSKEVQFFPHHLAISHISPTSISPTIHLMVLEILDLSYNLLSGVLPIFSPPSSRIRVVDLSSNHFEGKIPFAFFQQTWNLISFNVSNNTFNGSIPSSICLHSSPSIRLLDFSFNKFSGSISRGLGKCSKLQVFHAGNNNLSGLLPNDIYNATALQEISMAHNWLYGVVDDRIVNLTNLIILDLNSNQPSGNIPSNIGKLSSLKFMILHTNNLAGSLPQSLLNCTNLIELNLRFNNFEGVTSMFNFSKFVHLSKIDLQRNYFTGRYLPSKPLLMQILSLKSLSFLSLGGTRLTNVTGAMKILMRCKSLVALFFSYNFLGEEIPADGEMVEFNGFQNLQVLSVSYCELTGELPLWLSKLKKLRDLNLSLNRITGSIPSWLGTLPRLTFLDLQGNLFSGEVPKELCRLPIMVSEKAAARLDSTYLKLPIIFQPQGEAALEYNYLSLFPTYICIKNNSIHGNIPTEISQLQFLRSLDPSFNNFSGDIPNQISNLINLERLDLSMNQLSGEIPTSITSLTFLASFNVSHNNLQGLIPKSTQLQGFDVSEFEGNPKLCGAPLPNECPREIGTDEDDKKTEDVENEHHQVPVT
ncbi:hypothetical protein ABKV19_000320 [Rosa sericea]